MKPVKSVELKTPADLNHSMGGTFHYDEKGNFVEHEPPTKPRPPVAREAAASEPAADKAGAETKSAKRGTTQE